MDEPRPSPAPAPGPGDGPIPGLRRPPWTYDVGGIIIALVLIGLAVMIAIPALIIGACVVGLFFAAMGVRSLILRFKEGPRTDTMRKNVRVVVRREP